MEVGQDLHGVVELHRGCGIRPKVELVVNVLNRTSGANFFSGTCISSGTSGTGVACVAARRAGTVAGGQENVVIADPNAWFD